MDQPLRLGVAGLGTVGAGLLTLLQEHGERLAQTLVAQQYTLNQLRSKLAS